MNDQPTKDEPWKAQDWIVLIIFAYFIFTFGILKVLLAFFIFSVIFIIIMRIRFTLFGLMIMAWMSGRN